MKDEPVERVVDRIIERAEILLEGTLYDLGYDPDEHNVPRKVHAPAARRALVTAIVEEITKALKQGSKSAT